MLPKSRGPLGRSRTPPRDERRPPVAAAATAQLAGARNVARRLVASHWPELAAVAPAVIARRPERPDRALLARLGLSEADLGRPASPSEYSFTFVAEPTAGAPLVAVVVVDAQQRVVKISVSK